MRLNLDPSNIEDYRTFLRVKRLPQYRIAGRTAEFPDEYNALLGIDAAASSPATYKPIAGLFDYQKDIAWAALRPSAPACQSTRRTSPK